MDNIIDYVTKTPANSNPNVLKDMLQNYSGGSSAIPDWDAKEGEEGFIKNRPFYRTIEKTAIYGNGSLGPWESESPSSPEIAIEIEEDIGYIPLTQLLEEKKISVIIDKEEYSNISYTIDTPDNSGNQAYYISDENEEIFGIHSRYISSSNTYILEDIGLYNQPNFKPEDTHGIAILEANETITTNYLPPIYWNMIVDPPSMGGGGINTTSTGIGSHAEGMYTTSSNFGSHAEGYQTTASGHSSHAEGNTTQATGQQAHAEGAQTIATGDYSHAEGKGTIALTEAQHVFGTYNEEDPFWNPKQNYPGIYIEIVGNGNNANSRSNARTLDWDGNEELAGNLTAKGGSITLGSTTITENQLQQLIALLNT